MTTEVHLELLKKVPLFADLPEEDLRALCASAEEVRLNQGQQLFAEGDPGDRAYVVTEGTLEVVKASVGRQVLLNVLGPGSVVGEMALLEHNPRMASVNAQTDSHLLAITKDQLDELLDTSLPAVRALFYTTLGRLRATESLLRQGEKMAQLGTLTAGVAHELNNPAAAVKRGAGQIADLIARHAEARVGLADAGLPHGRVQAVEVAAQEASTAATRMIDLDPLTRSDRESEIETWLEDVGVEDAWDMAPSLVSAGYDTASLSSLTEGLSHPQSAAVADWVASTFAVNDLLAEISQGAGRISDIVKALKSYSYLDQAPVQEVDVHEGIDNTLLILRSKLKQGVEIRREYSPDLPKIQAYGSELNQVWTNLIDNAIDALDGSGVVTLRTHCDSDWVTVEVEDNGPGIPEEVQPRIFDAFFTTKPPGKGTGLGLDISYNIVTYKHKGEIKVSSEPGRTTFSVKLPVNP